MWLRPRRSDVSPSAVRRPPRYGLAPLLLICAADAYATPDVDGPYLWNLDDDDIEGMLDHFYVAEFGGEPAYTTQEMNFVKWQLTAPFACYKFDGLCAQYGAQGAEDFVKAVTLYSLTLPTLPAWKTQVAAYWSYYALATENDDAYALSAAETAQFHAEIDAIYTSLSLTQVQALLPPPGFETGSANGGDVEVSTGRARYLWAGHSWGTARPMLGGVNVQNNVSIEGTFEVGESYAGNFVASFTDTASRTRNAKKVTVVGTWRHWSINLFSPSSELRNACVGSSFLQSRAIERFFRSP